MRGECICIILLCLILAPALAVDELNTTTYVSGDSFVMDDMTIAIVNTYEGNVSLKQNGWGRILAVDECMHASRTYFCIDDADNSSTDITFYDKQLNVTLTTQVPESMEVGTEYKINLTLHSTLPVATSTTLQAYTNITVLKQSGFTKDLYWKDILQPGQKKLLSYTVIPQWPGEYSVNTTYSAEENNTQGEKIVAEDFLTFDTAYEEKPTRSTPYNFTLEITSTKSGELEVDITLPEELSILEKGNLSIEKTQMHASDNMNQTRVYWFTYTTNKILNSSIDVRVTTTVDNTEIERKKQYPLETAAFLEPLLVHNYKELNATVNESIPLSFVLVNQNMYALPITIDIASVLLEEEKTYTLQANSSQNFSITVRPNASNSVYTIRIKRTFADDKDEDITRTETIKIRTPIKEFVPSNRTLLPQKQEEVQEIEPTTPTIPQSITLLGPKNSSPNEEFTLYITILGVEERGAQFILTKNNETLANNTVDITPTTTLSRALSGPGTYSATITLYNTTLLTDTLIIEEVAPPEKISTPLPPQATHWTLIIAIIIVLAAAGGGSLITLRTRGPHRIRRLEQRIAEGEQEIAQQQELLASFYPASNEDFSLKEELQRALGERQMHILHMKQEVQRLSASNKNV